LTTTKKNVPKGGPPLIISVLKEAKKPLTTRELQQEVHKRVDFCLFDSVVALNLMRLSGTIQAKRNNEGVWIWWVKDTEEDESITI
jgi:hypothetical protein